MPSRSRILSNILIPISVILMVGGCVSPHTQRPSATSAELAREQEYEAGAALKNPFPPIIEPVRATQKMKKRLGAIAQRVEPQATKLCFELYAGNMSERCTFNLAIKGSTGVNAYADGTGVVVSAPMMEFAQNDTHLAFVVAHELAHNIMRHHEGQRANVALGTLLGTMVDIASASQGMDTQGTYGKVGGGMGGLSYSPDFEQEADYVGLYILARAGYPIEQAPNFWRAFSQFDPQGIYARSTHPTNAERFVAMHKTIAEIKLKKQRRQPLVPNILFSPTAS